jgi:hypothetical protein
VTLALRPPGSALAGLRHFLFGYDVFISYSRADATVYAAQLADALVDLDLRVYLDQLGSTPDEGLPPAVLAPLRASRALVLIGTPAAARSAAVAQELRYFGEVRTAGIIIPIDVDDSCAGADWAAAIRGLARTTEQAASIAGGHVSRDVVQRVASSCTFTRRNRRMRRLFWSTLAATVLVVALGAVAATLIERKARHEVARSRHELATAEAASRLETRASAVLAHWRWSTLGRVRLPCPVIPPFVLSRCCRRCWRVFGSACAFRCRGRCWRPTSASMARRPSSSSRAPLRAGGSPSRS